jgi:hypothetical protein
LLPSIGFGAVFGTTDTNVASATVSGLNLLSGVRFLLSRSVGSGPFAGIGYSYHALLLYGGVGTPDANTSFVGEHTITARAGYAFDGRLLRLRPELALLYVPSKNYINAVAAGSSDAWSGGWSVTALIGLSISLASNQPEGRKDL